MCAVVLGSDTTDHRFAGARQLLDYGFANYTVYTPSVDVGQMEPVPVLRGVERQVALTVRPMEPLLLKKGEESLVGYRVTLAENVEAPVLEGQTLGKVEVLLGETAVATYPILAACAVERMTVGKAFSRLLTALLGGH